MPVQACLPCQKPPSALGAELPDWGGRVVLCFASSVCSSTQLNTSPSIYCSLEERRWLTCPSLWGQFYCFSYCQSQGKINHALLQCDGRELACQCASAGLAVAQILDLVRDTSQPVWHYKVTTASQVLALSLTQARSNPFETVEWSFIVNKQPWKTARKV